MPSWQQRSSSGGDGGRGRGHNKYNSNSGMKNDFIGELVNYFHITMFRRVTKFLFYFISASNFEQNRNTSGPPRGGRVQAGWSAPPQSNFQPAFESGGSYSKQGGIQDQRTRSPYQYGGNVQSYSSPSDRGGYYRGRGGYQNYGSSHSRSNEDYRRNERTRNY